MLLIIYSSFLIALADIFSITTLTLTFMRFQAGVASLKWICIQGFLGLILAIIFSYIISLFLKYHLDLVLRNVTTIEQLDEKRGNPMQFSFDMGREWNWNFVFGKNQWLWFIPYDQGSAAPIGDGTVFMKQNLIDKSSSKDEENFYQNDVYDQASWQNDENFNDPLNLQNEFYTSKNNPLSQNLVI